MIGIASIEKFYYFIFLEILLSYLHEQVKLMFKHIPVEMQLLIHSSYLVMAIRPFERNTRKIDDI